MLDLSPDLPSKADRTAALRLQNAIRVRSLALRKPGGGAPPVFDDGLEADVFGADGTGFDLDRFRDFAILHAKYTHGQLLQDLWAGFELGAKTGGYFVEFGATNGMTFSNSILLERHFDWDGILAEPNPGFHPKLFSARGCAISTKCVHSVSGLQVEFLCATRPMMSRMAGADDADLELEGRVKVETISLNDLLDAHDAPKVVDFLSVDTEGSELDVLGAFDFAPRHVNLIAVEHNFGPNRAAIHDLLTGQGFVRRAMGLSRFDDWYRHRSIK